MTKPKKKDPPGIKIETKTLKLSSIKLNPANPRTITEKDMAYLVKSLEEFPDMMKLREIVVDEDGMILGGNMRFRALQQIGEKTCIVKIVKGLTAEQKREFIIKDNSSFGEFDMDILANEWAGLPLNEWGLDLSPDWFTPEPKKPQDAEPQIDKADELQKEWKTELGQIWEIGKHRLMCGDSTKQKDIKRLMDGKNPDSIVCDPPYGCTKHKWDRYPTQGELDLWLSMTEGAIILFGAALPQCLFALLSLKPQAERIYVWWNTFTLTNSEKAFWQWQPIYVWNKSKFTGLDRDVIDMAANTGGDEKFHETQKPSQLINRLLNAAGEGTNFDPFLGSGTSMVAAEQLSRICYGMEIEPKYVAVTLQRMKDAFPDIEIKKVNNGQG